MRLLATLPPAVQRTASLLHARTTSTRVRHVLAIFALSVILFTTYILSPFRTTHHTSLDLLPTEGVAELVPSGYYLPTSPDPHPDQRANATLLMLARNSDLIGAAQSVRRLEDRFNKNYRYPWVFLNDEPFSDEFKRRIRMMTDAPVEFGLIPPEHWVQPGWINETRAAEYRKKLVDIDIIYGDNVPYRNMCRFNSGFFYHQPLLQKYKWYWRVEPDVDFMCDINLDPFRYMIEHNKTYGFTVSLYEFRETVASLWDVTNEFRLAHPEFVAENNAARFLSDNGGVEYNLCHFWSNFEIADMDFWRGPAYSAYFELLESKGGFYYERWGDAPVHSLAAALFLSKDQIHFFNEIGYFHHPFQHCPQGDAWTQGRCACNPNDNFDYQWYSCKRRWDQLFW